MPLSPGDAAPDFDLPTEAGRVSLSGLKGKTVVLYFYPKDDTTGCTAEAQGFTAAAADFAEAGAVVVGVSKDSWAASHGKFNAHYDLAVTQGSAKDDDMVDRYGAWIEKSMYGRKYMGIDRSSYVIDKGGVISPGVAQGEGPRPRRRSAGRGQGAAGALSQAPRRSPRPNAAPSVPWPQSSLVNASRRTPSFY